MALTAAGAAINASLVRSVLTHRATVYGRGSGGTFTVVLQADLACRLAEVTGGRQPGATGAQRRDLANLGTFRYDATYSLPETGVQIEVDAFPGKRWNPVAAQSWPDDAPGIGVIGKSIDVVRAA